MMEGGGGGGGVGKGKEEEAWGRHNGMGCGTLI